MALRSRHGTARSTGLGRMVETRPIDEQGPGVLAPVQAEAGNERRPDGTLCKGATTTPRKGGQARKNRLALTHQAPIREAAADPGFRPFLGKGVAWRKATMRYLAANVGGGECDMLTSTLVSLAADQVATAKYFAARAAISLDPKDFASQKAAADSAKQLVIAARDMCTEAAASRPRENQAEAARRRWLAPANPEEPKS
jgi:hypothetical protein